MDDVDDNQHSISPPAIRDGEGLDFMPSDLDVLQSALAESLEQRAFLESILNASQDCIKVLSRDGDVLFMNSGGQMVMEVDDFETVRGCPWTGFWEGEHREKADQALAAAQGGGRGKFQGPAKTVKGTEKYWDVTVTPISHGGTDGHLLSISRDITTSQRALEQRELLSRELSHRVKNSLALAQAIASQTFRGADRDHLDQFNRRLAALGSAQSLLIQREWTSASTRSIVDEALRPICSLDRLSGIVDDVEIDGRRALSLAMALHELGTNSLKYGALSVPEGRVELNLSARDGLFGLTWQDANGPAVAPPDHVGFGTRLITRNLKSDFGGDVELNYHPSGVVLTLSAPL